MPKKSSKKQEREEARRKKERERLETKREEEKRAREPGPSAGPPGYSSSAAGAGVRRADEHVTLTKTGLPALIGNESPLGKESDPGYADRKSPSGKQSDPGYADRKSPSGKQSVPGYADRKSPSGKQSDPGYADRKSPSGKKSDPGYADRMSPSGIHRAVVPNSPSGIRQAVVPHSPSGNLQPLSRQNNALLHDPYAFNGYISPITLDNLLNNHNYLMNDDILIAILNLIRMQSTKRVVIISTHYKSGCNFSRNLYQGDIDDYEVIVIPIHIPSGNAGHWVLGIFQF